MNKCINFDEIIKHRVCRNYLINLFNIKQNQKKISPHRIALHNKTIENIHHIYNRDIMIFKNIGLNNYYKENILFKNNLSFIPYN